MFFYGISCPDESSVLGPGDMSFHMVIREGPSKEIKLKVNTLKKVSMNNLEHSVSLSLSQTLLLSQTLPLSHVLILSQILPLTQILPLSQILPLIKMLPASAHSSMRPSLYTFKHKYLHNQTVDCNQILSESSSG